MTEKVRNSSDLFQSQIRNAFNAFFNFLLPSVCVSCGHPGTMFCEQCHERVERLLTPIYVQNDVGKRPLSQAWAAAKFSGPIPDIIHNFKYNGHFALAKPLATIMVETWMLLTRPEIDLVVPIPLHHEREKKRGYNQAALLVKSFGSQIKLDTDFEAVRRIRHTRPQVGLSAKARQVNVSNAFWANEKRIAGKRILMIDDVFTTGATMSAAANALSAAGALAVFGYCVARAE